MARPRKLHPFARNLTIRINDEIYKRLDRISEIRGLSVGAMIRDEVLLPWLEKAERGIARHEHDEDK